MSVDPDLSCLKIQNPGNRLQRRGFPRSVVTDETENISGTDVQTQIRHSPFSSPVGFGKIPD